MQQATHIISSRSPVGFSRGFSLVEVMISMFVLALFILAFTKGLMYVKYMAEDNLFDATALTVAVSTIEQMKGAPINLLESPPKIDGKGTFKMIVEGGQERRVVLGEVNAMLIPITTDEDGSTVKTMNMEITPNITKMTAAAGYWLSVTYTYKHPRTGRERTEVVRNARSTVNN